MLGRYIFWGICRYRWVQVGLYVFIFVEKMDICEQRCRYIGVRYLCVYLGLNIEVYIQGLGDRQCIFFGYIFGDIWRYRNVLLCRCVYKYVRVFCYFRTGKDLSVGFVLYSYNMRSVRKRRFRYIFCVEIQLVLNIFFFQIFTYYGDLIFGNSFRKIFLYFFFWSVQNYFIGNLFRCLGDFYLVLCEVMFQRGFILTGVFLDCRFLSCFFYCFGLFSVLDRF